MKPTDRDPGDPVLDEFITRAPRAQQLSPGYTGNVISALRSRGLVHSERSPRRMLIAASWFLAGVGAGVATHYLITADDASPRSVAVAQATTDRAARDPEVWY